MVLLVAGLVILIEGVWGLGAGAKIPDPTNIYKEYGMNAFADMRLRFSMTVSIMSIRDRTYLGPRWNENTEAYELHGDFPNRTAETMFELIDAGTMDNVPANTRPRPADLLDARTQKFYLRFNETVIFRSQLINKYVATTGTHFNSDLFFTDDENLSERFRVCYIDPSSRSLAAGKEPTLTFALAVFVADVASFPLACAPHKPDDYQREHG